MGRLSARYSNDRFSPERARNWRDREVQITGQDRSDDGGDVVDETDESEGDDGDPRYPCQSPQGGAASGDAGKGP
jgi:hypothetical protein